METQDIDARIQEILIRYRKLRAMVWPARVSQDTIQRFRREVQDLEALRTKTLA